MQNLAHGASFHLEKRPAPSKPGTKHAATALGRRDVLAKLNMGSYVRASLQGRVPKHLLAVSTCPLDEPDRVAAEEDADGVRGGGRIA